MIWIEDLWCWKQLVWQLSHNHCSIWLTVNDPFSSRTTDWHSKPALPSHTCFWALAVFTTLWASGRRPGFTTTDVCSCNRTTKSFLQIWNSWPRAFATMKYCFKLANSRLRNILLCKKRSYVPSWVEYGDHYTTYLCIQIIWRKLCCVVVNF